MSSLRPSWSTPATVAYAGPLSADALGVVALRRTALALRRHLLAGIVFCLCSLAVLLHVAQLHIDPRQTGNLLYFVIFLAILALRFCLPRTSWALAEPVVRFAEYAAVFMIISLMGASASYPIAALTHGYADTTLQAIDEALGFDWLHWYRTVCDQPLLQLLGTIAYRSIYVTPALLLGYAALAGDDHRAYRFMFEFWLATVLTLAVFTLMPAVGPFSHLWHGAIPYMPESELWQQGLIPALRAHSVHVVDLGHLRGIVSAPSFHTAAAVLYVAAGWRIPQLRWPIVAINAAMLLSTPVEGTHYLIDMILGAIVALVALGLTELYERRLALRGI